MKWKTNHTSSMNNIFPRKEMYSWKESLKSKKGSVSTLKMKETKTIKFTKKNKGSLSSLLRSTKPIKEVKSHCHQRNKLCLFMSTLSRICLKRFQELMIWSNKMTVSKSTLMNSKTSWWDIFAVLIGKNWRNFLPFRVKKNLLDRLENLISLYRFR